MTIVALENECENAHVMKNLIKVGSTNFLYNIKYFIQNCHKF